MMLLVHFLARCARALRGRRRDDPRVPVDQHAVPDDTYPLS